MSNVVIYYLSTNKNNKNNTENLHQKVKSILLQNCNAVERKNLLEKPLHLVVNDVMVDEYSHETNNIEKTLDKHNIKKSSELTVFAGFFALLRCLLHLIHLIYI